MYETIVVGAGPAGLSAALTLGRARRRVLLLDGGPERHRRSGGVHMLLSRDGMTPSGLRAAALADLAAYPSVHIRAARAIRASGGLGGFSITLSDGSDVQAQRLILASGVRDMLPRIEGLERMWGRGVPHCIYCHGYERIGAAVAVLAVPPYGLHQALHLTRFSDDVVACTNAAVLPDELRELLARHGVALREEKLIRLEGRGAELERLVFADGSTLARDVLFCHPPACQGSDLAASLGCELLPDGSVKVDTLGRTSVPGVAAAGDMARSEDADRQHRVPVAAAAGVTAAVAVDQELLMAAFYGLPEDTCATLK
jgi:thioredoxin reductase